MSNWLLGPWPELDRSQQLAIVQKFALFGDEYWLGACFWHRRGSGPGQVRAVLSAFWEESATWMRAW